MRKLPIAVLAGAFAAASCAGGASPSSSTSVPPSTSSWTTSSAATSTTSAVTSTLPATTSTSTPTTTTTEPAPTTTTATSTLPGPEEGFPAALPASRIPWGDVGAGWLLVRYEPAHTAGAGAEQGLFLIDPSDTTYFAAWWPTGERILDWSPEGRRVISYREGALVVSDLREGSAAAIPDAFYAGVGHDWELPWARWARFTRPTGRDLVVRLVEWNQRARLEGLHTDGTRFAPLVDLDLTPLVPDDNWLTLGLGINDLTWLYAESGTEVVVATTEGLSLLSNAGALVRRLDTPGVGCLLSRWWDQGSVLAACYEPDWVASPCWSRGGIGPGGGRILWAVPLNGSPATPLTEAVTCNPETGSPEHWAAYTDAVRVDGALALESETCCMCGSQLTFTAGDTVTAWDGFQGSPACAPDLIGRREDGLVVLDTMFDGQGRGLFGTVFQVALDGTILYPITPFFPGDYGGVLQVFMTEQTVR